MKKILHHTILAVSSIISNGTYAMVGTYPINARSSIIAWTSSAIIDIYICKAGT